MIDFKPRTIRRAQCFDINYRLLSDVIEELKAFNEKYPDANIEADYGEDYLGVYCSYNDVETPEEVQRRIQAAQVTEDYQRRQYEELKKKFG